MPLGSTVGPGPDVSHLGVSSLGPRMERIFPDCTWTSSENSSIETRESTTVFRIESLHFFPKIVSKRIVSSTGSRGLPSLARRKPTTSDHSGFASRVALRMVLHSSSLFANRFRVYCSPWGVKLYKPFLPWRVVKPMSRAVLRAKLTVDR